jgi:RNA-directed DNA polymerase
LTYKIIIQQWGRIFGGLGVEPPTWWFHAKSYTADSNLVFLKLFLLAQVKIERHVKIRAEATPYHSAYESYFAQRRKRSSKWSEEWHPV